MDQPWRRSMPGAAGLAVLLLAGPASAASQGSLAAASSGSIAITVSLRAPARIAGLSDFELEGAAAAGAVQDVCLKGASHTYTVAASGSGPGGAFRLSNGDASIAYRVEWLSPAGEEPIGALSSDAPATIRAVADPAHCGRAPGSGQLRIALDPLASESLQAGAPYTGALILTLAPE
jgi:hypothetical protein